MNTNCVVVGAILVSFIDFLTTVTYRMQCFVQFQWSKFRIGCPFCDDTRAAPCRCCLIFGGLSVEIHKTDSRKLLPELAISFCDFPQLSIGMKSVRPFADTRFSHEIFNRIYIHTLWVIATNLNIDILIHKLLSFNQWKMPKQFTFSQLVLPHLILVAFLFSATYRSLARLKQ